MREREEERDRMEAYAMARGRDLMRFYCSNDVTRPLFSDSVARRKTMNSIASTPRSYFDFLTLFMRIDSTGFKFFNLLKIT